KSEALRLAELPNEEFDQLCVELERLQTVITRTAATTAASIAIKLRCVLDAMVDERSAHAAVLNGGIADAGYVSKAETAEQMLWCMREQVEGGSSALAPIRQGIGG